jgi:hypothetical protein
MKEARNAAVYRRAKTVYRRPKRSIAAAEAVCRNGENDLSQRRKRLIAGRDGDPMEVPAILERFQAKWTPVRVKKTRQIKNLEPRFDSIEAEKALGRLARRGVLRDQFHKAGFFVRGQGDGPGFHAGSGAPPAVHPQRDPASGQRQRRQ